MNWRRALLVTTLAVAGGTFSPAAGQDALLLGGKFLSASRSFGQPIGPGPQVGARQIFGGGRFAAVPAGDRLDTVVLDGRLGAAVYRLPTASLIALDRARPRLFVQRPSGIHAVALPGGAVSLVVPRADLQQCRYAYSADRLVCHVVRPDGRSDVTVVEVSSGTLRVAATIDALLSACFPAQPCTPVAMHWEVPPDGSRLYYGYQGPVSPQIGALDLDLGVTVGAISLAGQTFWDELNQRLIRGAGGFSGPATLEVFDRDLRLRAEVPSPIDGLAILRDAVVSPHTGRLYLYAWNEYLRNNFETLAVVDATTYAPSGVSDTTSAYRDKGGSLAVLSAPGVPRTLRATVAGHDVGLAWVNVGAASHFVLDIGLAPGRTDLSVYLGPDAHASFAGVPSGSYYVRLRGGNEFGGGRASEEVRVVVP